MAKVCCEKYPMGSFPNQKSAGFFLDDNLKANLDILLNNITKDWDFTILISGNGMVRVGKSTIAKQIAEYWTEELKRRFGIDIPFTLDNFVFDGTELIRKGYELGKSYPYSVLCYDEAGADLMGRKIMNQMTQSVMDFYRECGQFNFLNILVLPEFFDLPKQIAINRSFFLIDVFVKPNETNLERGHFRFYSRDRKKKLYIYGKKELNYDAWKADFEGGFTMFSPFDEVAYKKRKEDAFISRDLKKREKLTKYIWQRDCLLFVLTHYTKFGSEGLSNTLKKVTLDKWKMSSKCIEDASRKFGFNAGAGYYESDWNLAEINKDNYGQKIELVEDESSDLL